MIRTQPSLQVTIKLSQVEGRELARFLEHLRRELAVEFYPADLDEVEDRLGDANAIARWLREEVQLVLTQPAAQTLLEALHIQLAEEAYEPSRSGLLLSLLRKIRQAETGHSDASRLGQLALCQS